MLLKWTTAALFSFFIVSPAFAEEVLCVKNLEQYNKNKAKLPEIFQNIPNDGLFFTLNNSIATAGIRIRIHQKGFFVFEYYKKKIFSSYEEDGVTVNNICFQDEKMTISFVDPKTKEGKEESVKVETNGLKISGQLLQATGRGAFESNRQMLQQRLSSQATQQLGTQ